MPLSNNSTDRERAHERGNEFTESGVRNIACYHMPITASLRGRPVKVIATGDWPGHSPVCQYIDSDGKIDWTEQDRLTVVDFNFLPLSADALQSVARNLNR